MEKQSFTPHCNFPPASNKFGTQTKMITLIFTLLLNVQAAWNAIGTSMQTVFLVTTGAVYHMQVLSSMLS